MTYDTDIILYFWTINAPDFGANQIKKSNKIRRMTTQPRMPREAKGEVTGQKG